MTNPVLPSRYTTLQLSTNTALMLSSTGVYASPNPSNSTITFGGTMSDVAGDPSTISWTATETSAYHYLSPAFGAIPDELASENSLGYTYPTNADLLADGFDGSAGAAILGSTVADETSTTESIGYTFSAPLPAGTVFALWDPGVELGVNDTFTFSASDGGTAVAPSGWSVTSVDPFTSGTDSGTYAYNSGTGTLTVSNYGSGSLGFVLPRKVVLVTINTPVDAFTVTASTSPYDVFGLSVIAPASAVQSVTDTVAGAGGTTFSVPVASASAGATLQRLLNQISASVSGGSASVYAAGASTTPASPSGTAVLEATGAFSGALSTYTAFISNATTPTTLAGGTSTSEIVVTGNGGLTFTPLSVSGGGNVTAGGGNNAFIAPATEGGNWNVGFSAGNNTVVAPSGNDTIDAGTGANLIFLGAGQNVVTTEGVDTLVTGAGAATVQAVGTSVLLFAGTGGVSFVDASGVNTVVALAGGTDSLQGGSGSMLAFTFAPTSYVGGAGSDTIVAVSGGLTVAGGSGNGLYFGAATGSNSIFGGTGSATIIGGGAGDVLATGGSGTNIVAAGSGAETITAAQSSGSNTFFLFGGTDDAIGGTGVNAYSIGTGTDTISAAGTANLFVLYNITGAPATVLIDNFTPGRDFVQLNGFANGAASTAVAAQSATGAGDVVTLSNGTTITFAGLTTVQTSSFI